MDTKGINEKMLILFIVVAMLMSATCLDGENISSTKSNGKKTLTRSSLDRDSCTKYCMMTKCMPRYHNQKRCFDTCHFYCTEPLAHFIYRNVDSSSTSTSYITQKPCKESSRLLDLLPGNYILNSFKNQHYSRKTCILRRIHLPSNHSGINLDAVRFPSGSLR
ncbi:hypothetical protein YC2023_114884 [Brassica napus]